MQRPNIVGNRAGAPAVKPGCRLRFGSLLCGLLLTVGGAATAAAAESFEDAYLRTLAAWSSKPEIAAVEELGELAAESPSRLERIGQAQRRIARRLARAAPESILPLAYLHHLAYAAHLREEEFSQASHTAELVLDLVKLYRGRSDEPQAAERAARILTSMAAVAGTVTLFPLERTRESFLAALDLDPRSRGALHGLAFTEEQLGEHRRAVTPLAKLIRLDPDNREARLRLALNRARSGGTETAAVALQALARGPAADWIAILAFQELARLEQAAGRVESALALLQEAVARFPRDQQLAIQLAFALHPRWDAATAQLERLLARGRGESDPSPRVLYDLGPADDFEAARAALRRDVEARLPDLEKALEAVREADAEPATMAPAPTSEEHPR